MGSPDILTLGEPLVEMVRLPDQGGAPVYSQGIAGDVLNVAVAAARQGGSVGLLGAVGGDPFGQDVLAFCAGEGIDTRAVLVRGDDPTGVAFIDPDPAERRFFYARRGSAASFYGPDDLPEDLIANAKVIHVSAISQAISASMRKAVRRAAEIARANDTLVSYDLNLRLKLWTLEQARRAIEDFLPFADIVLPSDDEAALLVGSEDAHLQLAHFSRHGPAWVALKRGANGAILQGRGAQHVIAASKVRALDSAGAGDSFAGTFLAHLLASGDGLSAARAATHVAAQTVTGLGATAPIPRL